MMKILLILLFVTVANCNPCSVKESLNVTSGELFFNGSVIYDGLEYPSSAWYETEEEGMVVRWGCPCIGRVCLWKCCPKGQMFFGRECYDTDFSGVNPFSPPVHKGDNPVNVTAHERFFFMHNRLCDDRYGVDTDSDNEHIYIQEVSQSVYNCLLTKLICISAVC
jgi:hypothetical protein